MHRLLPLLPVAALLLLAAADAPPLRPGEWMFTNAPGEAMLDGRPLHDLPVGETSSERTCLTPGQAMDPAAWLARDLAGECTLTRRLLADGRIDIAGRCPPRDDGQPEGTLKIAGRYTSNHYQARFTTVAHGENGIMSFAGTMRGDRSGDCTPTPASPSGTSSR